MKLKKIAVFLSVAMMTNLFTVRAENKGIEYFVDCNVEKSGDGTFSSPFKTIEEAKNKIRQLKNAKMYPEGGVIVTLRGGLYRTNETIVFSKEDSGKKDAPVVYRSYPLEEVVFTGGSTISFSSFSKSTDERIPESAKGKVYQYNIRKDGVDYDKLNVTGHSAYYMWLYGLIDSDNLAPVPEIYFNDNNMTIARFPNDNAYMRIEKVIEPGYAVHDMCDGIDTVEMIVRKNPDDFAKPIFVPANVTQDQMQKWENADDAWMFGYWYFDWSDQTIPVKSVDSSKREITLDMPSAYTMRNEQRCYIYNLIEELDSPGEWYFDKSNGELYIYPLDNNPDSKVDIAFASNDFLLIRDAENLEFRNLTFSGTRASGIKIWSSSDIKVFGCTVKNVAAGGISTDEPSRRITIDSCHVYNIGNRAVSLMCGNNDTLEPGDSIVTNCWIHDFGRLVKTYSGAIVLNGVANKIRNNLMYNGAHYAMGFGGNDNLIERNEIHDVLKEANDAGVLYTGKSTIQRGQIIRENIIYDIKSDSVDSQQYGVYIDDMGAGVTVEDNLFYNIDGSAVFINGGRDNHVNNNVFANIRGNGLEMSAIGLATSWGYDLEFFKKYLLRQTNLETTAPYQKYEHLPEILSDEPLKPKYNQYKNNIGYKIGKMDELAPFNEYGSTITESEMREINEIADNVKINSADAFEDSESGNYNVVADSMLLEMAPVFKPVDFSKSGLITSRLKYNLSDGAIVLAMNTPIAYVNWKQRLIDENNLDIMPFIENNNTMVPLRFLAEALGGIVDFNEGNISVNCNGHTLSLKSGSTSANIDGTEISLNAPAKNVNNRIFVPLRNCSELFDKKVFWDERGLIIVSDKDMTSVVDEDMILNLIERIKY